MVSFYFEVYTRSRLKGVEKAAKGKLGTCCRAGLCLHRHYQEEISQIR